MHQTICHVLVCLVQSNAKSTYLLSDSDLAGLGFLEKQNPHHKEFSTMKMLLVSQVSGTSSLATFTDDNHGVKQGWRSLHRRQLKLFNCSKNLQLPAPIMILLPTQNSMATTYWQRQPCCIWLRWRTSLS